MHPPQSHAHAFWTRVAMGAPEDCWEWAKSKNKCGYGTLAHGGKTMLAHRVAYLLVTGELPPGRVICHTCDNPACCNPAHLWAGTMLENTRDCISKGRLRRAIGERSGNSKLRACDIPAIISDYKAGVVRSDIARKYGVNWSTIDRVLKGRGWNHDGLVDQDLTKDHDERDRKIRCSRAHRGVSHGRATFTEDQVTAVRSRYANGETKSEIARSCNRSFSAIDSIIKRRTWAHIP